MKYVFGPVPSRRLGQSLGIDPVPLKTCNWNCVYCQLGRTVPLINERKEFIPREEIFKEIKQTLVKHSPGEIDWVTFVGSGETTLNSELGWMIKRTKEITDLPVAVITNGSLLYLPEVRNELLFADAVLPTLDAGNPDLYRKINRPHPEITYERLISGLTAFRREYKGKLWVEVMLVQGLNDTRETLIEIANALKDVNPDEIHINLPTRPPVEKWVRPPTEESVNLAMGIFGELAHVVRPADGYFDLGVGDDLEEAVIGIITRHPMRQEELERALEQWAPTEVQKTLDNLLASGKALVVERNGVLFWSSGSAHYPK